MGSNLIHSQRLRQLGIVSLCGILLFAQWGCATHSVEIPEPFGTETIGVVAAQYTPSVEFELPAKGWLGGAARGAVGGTKAFIVLVPSAAVLAGASFAALCCTFGAGAGHGLVGGLWAAAALVKGAGYMIAGPFYGAAAAEAPATVEEAEEQLKATLVSMRMQETMRNHVVHAARVANINLTVLDGQGPESPSDLLTYFPLHDTNVDSVLELRVTRLWLSTNESFFAPLTTIKPSPSQELEINPPLSLGMEVRGRLIRTADRVVLYDNIWTSEGESHLFVEWAANDAQRFMKEFERAFNSLADQVVTTIF